MRLFRTSCLLATALSAACATSMRAQDAAAAKRCTETISLHETPEADRYAATMEVSGWTVDELVRRACEVRADAVVGLHSETFRTTTGDGEVLWVGHAATLVPPSGQRAESELEPEPQLEPESEPEPQFEPESEPQTPAPEVGGTLPDAVAGAQTPEPRAEADRRPPPKPEPAAPARDPALRRDIERSVARRQEESPAVPKAVETHVSRAKRLEESVSPRAAVGMSVLVTAVGVGGGIFLVASGAELGLVLIPVSALVGPSTGLMMARRHGRAWAQVGIRAALYGIFAVATILAASDGGPGWGAVAVASFLGGIGMTVYSFWDAYDKATELDAPRTAQHTSAAPGDDSVQIHPFVLRDGGGGLVLKHSF